MSTEESTEEISKVDLPGRAPGAADGEPLQWARHFCESAGWHFVDGIGVSVAQQAMSMRSPNPRFPILDFPLRTVVAKFRDERGLPACEF